MTSCDNCYYFRDRKDDFGLCRKNSPAPILMREDEDDDEPVIVQWPIMCEDEWCGDWAAGAVQ